MTLKEIRQSRGLSRKHIEHSLLPPGGNLSPNDLKRWWMRRAVPLSQGKIRRILSNHNIPTPQNYLAGYHKKIALLQELQSGKQIFSYQYQRNH